MRNIGIYALAAFLLLPCVLIASDSLLGAFIAISWGVVLYHSPKFCPAFKKFWMALWKII